jgi:uncharacterized membrane protein YraQ (UPF0718 family)
MEEFLQNQSEAAITTLGMFWMAFWAFGLGYLVSSMIQVFVTEKRMKKTMGESGSKSVALGTFFGFISSSCSFAALATTRSLFAKGAGLAPSLAFLLASTNLVIELGIIIGVFLSWQFIVGEYVGGLLLILLVWLFIKIKYPKKLVDEAREKAKDHSASDENGDESKSWRQLITSKEGWKKVCHRYVMEWKMVWKDVTVGFTVAGIIAVFVPASFFETLFIGGGQGDYSFWQVLAHTVIGPIAAFFTFIGSMGNIPLAAVLFANGVSFAGIIAFIFSDLVVFPVLRIQTKFYGFKMAMYIAGLFLAALISTALLLHYGLSFFDLLPSQEDVKSVIDRDYFKINYTFFLNLFFIILTFIMGFVGIKQMGEMSMQNDKKIETILFWLALMAFVWLAVGLIMKLIGV